MSLVTGRFICLFVGLEHMQSMTNSVQMTGNLILININQQEWKLSNTK